MRCASPARSVPSGGATSPVTTNSPASSGVAEAAHRLPSLGLGAWARASVRMSTRPGFSFIAVVLRRQRLVGLRPRALLGEALGGSRRARTRGRVSTSHMPSHMPPHGPLSSPFGHVVTGQMPRGAVQHAVAAHLAALLEHPVPHHVAEEHATRARGRPASDGRPPRLRRRRRTRARERRRPRPSSPRACAARALVRRRGTRPRRPTSR